MMRISMDLSKREEWQARDDGGCQVEGEWAFGAVKKKSRREEGEMLRGGVEGAYWHGWIGCIRIILIIAGSINLLVCRVPIGTHQ